MGPTAVGLRIEPAARHHADVGVRRLDDGPARVDPGDVVVGLHQDVGIPQLVGFLPHAQVVHLGAGHRLARLAPQPDRELDDLIGRPPQAVADEPDAVEMPDTFARLPPDPLAADVAAGRRPVNAARGEVNEILSPGGRMLTLEGEFRSSLRSRSEGEAVRAPPNLL